MNYARTAAYRNLRFKPWVGNKYESSSIGLRILIIGESHYWLTGRVPSDLTNLVIHKVRSRRSPPRATIGQVERIINAILPEAKGEEAWDEIAFYNYLQSWVGKRADHRPDPTEFHKKQCSEGLVAILHVLKPDLVIVLGTGLFKILSENEPGPVLNVGENNFPTWLYETGIGKSAVAVGIKHPGKFFSLPKWLPVIRTSVRRARRHTNTQTKGLSR